MYRNCRPPPIHQSSAIAAAVITRTSDWIGTLGAHERTHHGAYLAPNGETETGHAGAVAAPGTA